MLVWVPPVLPYMTCTLLFTRKLPPWAVRGWLLNGFYHQRFSLVDTSNPPHLNGYLWDYVAHCFSFRIFTKETTPWDDGRDPYIHKEKKELELGTWKMLILKFSRSRTGDGSGTAEKCEGIHCPWLLLRMIHSQYRQKGVSKIDWIMGRYPTSWKINWSGLCSGRVSV